MAGSHPEIIPPSDNSQNNQGGEKSVSRSSSFKKKDYAVETIQKKEEQKQTQYGESLSSQTGSTEQTEKEWEKGPYSPKHFFTALSERRPDVVSAEAKEQLSSQIEILEKQKTDVEGTFANLDKSLSIRRKSLMDNRLFGKRQIEKCPE